MGQSETYYELDGANWFHRQILSADIRPGGESHYEINGNGASMYGKAKYLEMLEPTRIVYTQIFVDQDGKISRHPLAPTWPEIMKTTVTLCEEGDKQTRVTVEWQVDGDATQEERATFGSAKTGMTHGWTGSFDKLEECLKSLRDTAR